jgi:predicted ribosome quality control (RQC) complex YloA/Tae2 family protein
MVRELPHRAPSPTQLRAPSKFQVSALPIFHPFHTQDPMKARHYNPDCWHYTLAGDFEVLAGKTDADNDLLSLKVAKANDLWFHVHGMPGSHVILRHPDGDKPDTATIKQAAAIAAWHSKARNAGTVSISCTEAKHVSKPRGAKPGTVAIKREKQIKVRPALPISPS